MNAYPKDWISIFLIWQKVNEGVRLYKLLKNLTISHCITINNFVYLL